MAIALVQSVSVTNPSGTAVGVLTATITGTKAGNLLLIGNTGSNNTATYTPSVAAGTAQTFVASAASPQTANAGQNTSVWYVVNCAAGTTQISVTRAAGTGQQCMVVEEWSGLIAAPFDVSAANTNTGSTAVDSGTSATTAQATELWWAFLSQAWTAAIAFSAPTNGFTAQTFASGTDGSTAYKASQTLNKIVSATGLATTAMTSTQAGTDNGQILTFKGVAPPATPLSPGYFFKDSAFGSPNG